MSFEYVQQHYNVPACMGRKIKHNGKPGIIVKDRGHYIGVTFDDDKPNIVYNVHPTDNVEYGEIGKIRKVTRSQARYQEYLRHGDWADNFAEFLGITTP